MPGLKDFTKESNAYRVVTTQAANYTVLLSDELIRTNGTVTMTLPVISTMQGTTYHQKTYRFQNIHASLTATISAGTGNTIEGQSTTFPLYPNEVIVLTAAEGDTAWNICQPTPLPVLIRQTCIMDMTMASGLALSQRIWGGFGAPTDVRLIDVWVLGLTSVSGTFTMSLVGGSTIYSIALGSAMSGTIVPTAIAGLEVTAVAKGVDINCMLTEGNAKVKIFADTQEVAIAT